ncbi:MAG: mechanosensitive ion channel family protein [Actinomycetota bacterium]|nr:mechanosensitive ion channel family protein [Actinomycetota bacterium]
MTVLASSVLGQSGQAVGSFLPRLGGALALLIIGLLLVRLLSRLVVKALQGLNLDDLAERAGVNRVLERAGLGSSLAELTGRAVRIAASVVVIFAALSLLGLQFLSQSLNQGVLLLPKLLLAAALVLAGVVLAGVARERVDRLTYQLDLPVPLGGVAQATVLAVSGIIAASQIGVPTLVLLILIAILLSGAAATLALAFGLGGRDAARALSAGRYLRHDYEVGQEIGFDEVRGRIVAIENISTIVDTEDGRSVRVPNHLLMQTVVTVYAPRGHRQAENVA